MAIIHTHVPKRRAKKPNAKQRQLASSWQEILKKYEPKKKIEAKASRAQVYKEPTTYRRETAFIPSLGTHQGDCSRKQQQTYTGSAMMGIATLHKSNAVPVFSQEDAVEISRMRRG